MRLHSVNQANKQLVDKKLPKNQKIAPLFFCNIKLMLIFIELLEALLKQQQVDNLFFRDSLLID